jgi:hypothetical protein
MSDFMPMRLRRAKSRDLGGLAMPRRTVKVYVAFANLPVGHVVDKNWIPTNCAISLKFVSPSFSSKWHFLGSLQAHYDGIGSTSLQT